MTAPSAESIRQVLSVASAWRDSCLIGDGSMLTPGCEVWTTVALEDLWRRFVESPDEGSRSFFEKFEDQLAGAADATVQLAAEALYVHFLTPLDIRPTTKRGFVEMVLGWANEPVEVDEDAWTALEHGYARTGPAFKTYRPHQLWQLLTFTRDVKGRSADARRELLSDPWRTKEAIYGNLVQAANSQRNALLFLLHPQTFDPTVSDRYKRRIVQGLAEHAPEDDDVDRQLLAIRKALEAESGGPVDFYDAEYREQWDVPKKQIRASASSSMTAEAVEARLAELCPDGDQRRLVAERLLASIRIARRHGDECWGTTVRRRLIRLNVGRMQTLALKAGETVIVLSSTGFDDPKYDPVRPFVRRQPGEYSSKPDALDVVVPHEALADVLPLVGELHEALVEDLASNSRGTPYRRSHEPMVARFLEQWLDADGEGEEVAGISLSDLESTLHLTEGSLETVHDLLEDKGQVILCGPPGTGKTFVARQLAGFVAGDPSRVTKVQFHPSFAYEDFVEGIRPRLVGDRTAFELRDGPLKRVAKAAAADPDHTYVLLVDEINRGNLAKVFGELYFLLEYRDEALELPYSGERFSIPENLRVIGTMNTADRSIALVDLALRRRFHFVEFFPDAEPIRGVLGRYLADHAPEMAWLTDVVDRANRRLGDRDCAIGPSYFLRDDLDDELVERIWEYSVLPYVAEQLYGEPERLREFGLDALRRGEAAAAGE